MSEQREAEVGVFDRVFNAAARARQELTASNQDELLSATRRLFRRHVQRIRGKFC